MPSNTQIPAYSRLSKTLHWLSAALIFGLFGLGLWMMTLDYYSPWYQKAPDLHKSIGIFLALVVMFRVFWRQKEGQIQSLDSHQRWEKIAGKTVHILLYILIFLIILSGYFTATADFRGVSFFNLFEIPPILSGIDNQEDIAGFIHEWLAYAMMALVLLHIAAGLKHHLIDKDDTLKRMY